MCVRLHLIISSVPDADVMADRLSDRRSELIQFKTWKDNFLLKSVVCLTIMFVIIIIFVVIIYNYMF